MGVHQSHDPGSSSGEEAEKEETAPEKNAKKATTKDDPRSMPNSLYDRVTTVLGPNVAATPKRPTPVAEPPKPALPVETVPTAFKWSNGGEKVFVTGSFNNWQGKIMMHKNEDNPQEFVLVIDIPPGLHQYKFIVDDEWRLNPDLPTIVNGQEKNNVVEVKRPVFEQQASPFDDSDDDEVDENGRKLVYGQVIPPPEAYASVPLKAPPQLSPQNIILNKDCDNKGDPYLLCTPGHELLNHMCIQGNGSEKSGVVVTSITQRFRTKQSISITPKFVTLIYYKPVSATKDP